MTRPKSAFHSLNLLLFLIVCAATPLTATGDPSLQVNFDRDIRPILAENCFHCHGADEATREADLRLDVRKGAVKQGGVIVPGVPEESLLIERIFAEDPSERMPPPESKLTLTEEQKQAVLQWVSSGASWQPHWSLIPPVRPQPPQETATDWGHNAIDRFVLAQLERENLQPSAQASRARLLRRVTLDLTGLPPTLPEIDAFLSDPSDDAYEKVVDRLLASPRYGERMAWDWLDAARYADTNGYQGDPERTMWPWRDWVIEAMNANMPFDQFTIQQIAGDLLPDATLATRIATGFNRNNMHNGEGGRIAEESRVENVMDRTETVGAVWLGLTLTCCRCHDHKYDPLSMNDYYSFYAFFNNTSETGKGRSGKMEPVVTVTTEADDRRLAELDQQVTQAAAEVQADEQDRENAKHSPADELPEEIQTLLKVDVENRNPEQLEKLAKHNAKHSPADGLPEEIQTLLKVDVENRNPEQLEKLAKHFETTLADYGTKLSALREAVTERKRFAASLPRVMVMDHLETPRQTFILSRGAYDKPAEPVAPAVPATFSSLQEDAPRNRLGLAQWLLAKENPLTARVIMNRYWQIFFGKGLVSTPEDFGVQGHRPTHPELLDWLACEFRESGWDVKHMHRLLVTSATYRQNARISAELRQRDPNNIWLARGPRHRLPSWMIRDQALAASGLLVDRLGGPSVKPYQPDNVWAEATFGKKKYVQDHEDKLYRRSLYTFWRRIVGPTMFFDASKRQTCNVKSSITNTPLHALTTLNDITFVEAARALAQRVMQSEATDPRLRLARAFRLAIARQPREEELTILINRFQIIQREFESNPQAAADLLACGESPRDETLNPADHASYAAICSLILNLDETLTKE